MFMLPNTETMVLYLVNSLVAFFVVMISDRIIAHNIEPKHALILAIVSLFAVPIVAPLIGLYGAYASFLLSFVTWILLGEILLEADWMTKSKVLVIAFLVYYVIAFTVGDQITSFVRNFI